MLKENQEKGITLVALVITIIILLILAGVSIVLLGGDSGLFTKAKQGQKNYNISESKEKIEMAILDLKMDRYSKGKSLEKEDLLELKNNNIDVKDVSQFPVEVVDDIYKFKIDENYVVTYVGEVDETTITYTKNPDGPTNADSIEISIRIKNPKGLKLVKFPDDREDLNCENKTEVNIQYTVTENGTYTFSVIDAKDRTVEEKIIIDQFDRVAPMNVRMKATDIALEDFSVVVEVQQDETNQEEILKYEYYIKSSTDADYTKIDSTNKEYMFNNLELGKAYTAYVIVSDEAGNKSAPSATVNVTTRTKPLPPDVTMTINEETATKRVLDYPRLTLKGTMNCYLEPVVGEKIKLEITSPKRPNIMYCYSLDGGSNWNEYVEPITTDYIGDGKIKVMSIYKENVASNIRNVRKYLKDKSINATATNALLLAAYNDNFNDYYGCNNNKKYISIDQECWGEYISMTCETVGGTSTYGYLNLGSSLTNISDKAKGYMHALSGNTQKTKIAKSAVIPNGTNYAAFNTGTSTGATWYLYEIWCSIVNVTGNQYSNSNLP